MYVNTSISDMDDEDILTYTDTCAYIYACIYMNCWFFVHVK